MREIVTRLDWSKAKRLFDAAQKILIVGHARPDADAIGSICAMGAIAESYGKTAIMAVDEGVPDYLSFIPKSKEILPTLDQPEADLVICVDSSDVPVMGKVGQIAMSLASPTLVIDHHTSNTFFGQVHLIRSDAVSATDIIFDWAKKLNNSISASMAECLLIGIITDTQGFQVGPVTAETFYKVSELIKYGADFQKLRRLTIDDNTPLPILKLMGLAASRAEIDEGVIWSYLDLEDFDRVGAEANGTIGAADMMLTTQDVVIAAEFAQTNKGIIRLGLRARDGYDVGQVATMLGGGGHTKAAGASLEDTSLRLAVERVLPLLKTEAKK